MMVDVSAVPMMHAPDPDPAGNELDEASWAALIDTLCPRLLALAPRELCNFCRESYYHDLLRNADELAFECKPKPTQHPNH